MSTPIPPTARALAAAVLGGSVSARQATEAALEQIAARNGRTGAFLQICGDHALEHAAQIDARRQRGEAVGPLAGVPIAVKDNLCTTFARTTCGSRILDGYVSPYDASVIQRLQAADAVIVGKTNCDEFAMGSSNENSAFGPVRNPWNPERVPGGSSGGSAAAVADRLTPVALGSDTGGSIRQPASFCGVVGLKPTYGRVSRYGLVAYGSSLDQIGPLATTVEDAALLLSVISGCDPRDSTSAPEAVPDYAAGLLDAALDETARTLRIGVPREFFGDGLDPEVRSAVQAAIEVYCGLGATIVDVEVPRAPLSVAVYYVLATAEASSNLARFDGVHYGHRTDGEVDLETLYTRSRAEGFGAEVKRRIMLGTFALSSGYYDAYYNKALKVRRLIRDDFDAALAQCDVLISPVSPTPAFQLGAFTADPLQMYLADIFTIPVNLAGLPAISIPAGFSQDGLPIGVQLVGPHFGEPRLLQAARLHERATDWHTRRPANG